MPRNPTARPNMGPPIIPPKIERKEAGLTLGGPPVNATLLTASTLTKQTNIAMVFVPLLRARSIIWILVTAKGSASIELKLMSPCCFSGLWHVVECGQTHLVSLTNRFVTQRNRREDSEIVCVSQGAAVVISTVAVSVICVCARTMLHIHNCNDSDEANGQNRLAFYITAEQ